MSKPTQPTSLLTRLLTTLQTNHSNLPTLLETNTPRGEIIKSPTLTTHHLQRLFTHECSGIHISSFFHPATALSIGKQLSDKTYQGHATNWKINQGVRGMESSDVLTLGAHPPHNVAAATNQRESYFANVPRELTRHRGDSGGATHYWPMDFLRLTLDELWPGGAGLARDEGTGRVYGGGLPRVMIGPTRWRQGFVHVDEMAPLDPSRGLFSANIYLQLPEEGGTLEIWPLGVRSRWDWYRNAVLLSGLATQDVEKQLELREALGEPVVVDVQVGDLVLLCVQRPHAVVGFREGCRVSLQGFLEYSGEKERLTLEV